MTYQLYEVWSVDTDGHESLVDTSGDIKEARRLAAKALTEDVVCCIIYRETEEGDLEVIEEVEGL